MKDKDSQLIYEAYNKSSIENKFVKQIDVIAGQIDHGSRDDFDVRDFLKFKSHIKNWETLEAAIDQENTYGSSHLWDEIQFTSEAEAVKPAKGSALDGMLNPEDLGLDADLNPLEDDEFVDYYMSKDLDAIQELVSYLEGQFEEGTDYVLHTERGDSKSELPNTISIRKGFDDPELEELLDGARGAPEGEGEDDELNWFDHDHDDDGFADKDNPNPWA